MESMQLTFVAGLSLVSAACAGITVNMSERSACGMAHAEQNARSILLHFNRMTNDTRTARNRSTTFSISMQTLSPRRSFRFVMRSGKGGTCVYFRHSNQLWMRTTVSYTWISASGREPKISTRHFGAAALKTRARTPSSRRCVCGDVLKLWPYRRVESGETTMQ